MPLVHPLGVKAGLHERSGDAVGVRRGVGVDEAAGVRGDGHIQQQGDGGGDAHAHLDQNAVQQLRAGGAVGIDPRLLGVALVGAVVVDGQVNAVGIGLAAAREHPQGGRVHRHDELRHELRRGQHALEIGGEEPVGVLIGQHPGGLAQLAQGQAQGAGAANGVPVRAAVGEDEHVLHGQQTLGGLMVGHWSPPVSFRSMSLRSFKIWVPLSMESSAWNTSSGV